MNRAEYIKSLYRTYLGREPDEGGFAFYSNPDFSDDLIRQDIMNSPEAQQFAQRAASQPNLQDLARNEDYLVAASYARDYGSYPLTINGNTYTVLGDGSIAELPEFTPTPAIAAATPQSQEIVNAALQNQMDVGGLDFQQNWAIPAGVVNGTEFSVQGDKVVALTPNPSGIGAQQQIYDLQGNLLADDYLENFGKRNPITDAAVAATTGLFLGPAAVGLSAPTAAAIAAGAPRLNETGSLTEAAQAAALAGLTAYGAQSLFGGAGAAPSSIADDFVAADVVQLAAQGIPEEQIADILMRSGVSAQTAAAALDAQFGTSAPGAARDLGDFSSTTPNAVNVTGTSLFNPAAAIAPSLGGAISTLPSTAPSPNRVEVPGSRLPTENLTVDDLLAVLSPAITGALPPVTGGTTQQVGVTGSREPAASTTPGATGGAVGSALVPTATAPTQQVTTTGTRDTGSSALGGAASGALGGIVPGIQPAIPTASERVEVPGKREPGGETIPAVVGATLPTIPSTITQPLPEVAKPPAAKEESLFTPSDILKLLTLLGGGAAASNMGGGGGNVPVRGLPPSDTLIGSTTPQFGSDYYAAVQRYYNAFMPETPRNVAGPLQQWYENKFGA